MLKFFGTLVETKSSDSEIELATIIPNEFTKRNEKLQQYLKSFQYCCFFIVQTISEIDDLIKQYGAKENSPRRIQQSFERKMFEINDIMSHIIKSNMVNFLEEETRALAPYFGEIKIPELPAIGFEQRGT